MEVFHLKTGRYKPEYDARRHLIFPLSMDQETPLKIVVIVAGTNEPSNSNMLADSMVDGMKTQANLTVEKIRLKDLQIAHFNLSCYGTDCPIDGLTRVQKAITEADGVVIATPMWNFSVPAHLKNLIDRMGAFALDDESHSLGTLKGKPFFLIITAGMPKTAWPFIRKTVSHLPVSIQYFGGSVIGTHFEASCTLGRGVFGLVVDKRPESLKKISEHGVKFVKIAERFKRTGVLPLKYRLIKKIVQFAQKIKIRLGL